MPRTITSIRQRSPPRRLRRIQADRIITMAGGGIPEGAGFGDQGAVGHRRIIRTAIGLRGGQGDPGDGRGRRVRDQAPARGRVRARMARRTVDLAARLIHREARTFIRKV